MENIYNGLKNFLLLALPAYLAPLADDATPLAAPTEKDIIFGVADVSRYENSLLCVITPDEQVEADGTIGSVTMQTTCIVSFLLRGASYPVLMRKMCRYAAAFRRALQTDASAGGAFQNAAVQKVDFFADAGTTEKQMTAAEITITVETVENIRHTMPDDDAGEEW